LILPVHTYGGIHSEERKGRKSLFLFTAQLLRKTNLDPIFSKSESGTIAHKNKKRITIWQAPSHEPKCRRKLASMKIAKSLLTGTKPTYGGKKREKILVGRLQAPA
jgi:hypothetical protein